MVHAVLTMLIRPAETRWVGHARRLAAICFRGVTTLPSWLVLKGAPAAGSKNERG